MKKMTWRRILALGLAGALSVGMLAGCGSSDSDSKKSSKSSSEDPETLMADAAENLGDEENVVQDFVIVIDMESDDEAITLTFDQEVDVDLEDAISHGEGTASMSYDGESMDIDMENYVIGEDDEYTLYGSFLDEWTQSEIDYDFGGRAIADFEELSSYADDFEVTDKKGEIEDEDAIIMEGEVKVKNLPDVWRSAGVASNDVITLIESIEMEGKTKIPVTAAVYKDSGLPAQLKVDLTEALTELAEEEGEDVTVNELSATVTFRDYGDASKVELDDDDILDCASGTADLMVQMFGSGDLIGGDTDDPGTTGGTTTGVTQSADLGDNWDDYTIQLNDSVVTLPCSYDDMIAAGFVLDDDTDPELMVNKEDWEYGYFTAGNDVFDYFSVNFYNPSTEKAVAITEAVITSISIDEYAAEDGIAVMLPKGITFDSTRDDVIAAYGEPDDIYEGDSFDFLTYYDGDSYTKYLEITIDKEDNKIWEIDLYNR